LISSKVDTEGAEAFILPSMKDWLVEQGEHKPSLYVALHPPFYGGNLYSFAFEITEVLKLFTNLYITSTQRGGIMMKKVESFDVYNKILEGNELLSVLATEKTIQ